MNWLIKRLYELRGWEGFWQDPSTGKWYAYRSKQLDGYWSHEAERLPLPPLWRR